jgi:hypothetical protein
MINSTEEVSVTDASETIANRLTALESSVATIMAALPKLESDMAKFVPIGEAFAKSPTIFTAFGEATSIEAAVGGLIADVKNIAQQIGMSAVVAPLEVGKGSPAVPQTAEAAKAAAANAPGPGSVAAGETTLN